MTDLKRLLTIVGLSLMTMLTGCVSFADQTTGTSMTDFNTRLERLISKITNQEFFN